MKTYLLFALALMLVACPQPSPVPPSPDASDAAADWDSSDDGSHRKKDAQSVDANYPEGPCPTACANLGALGCGEGSATADCEKQCAIAQGDRLIKGFSPTCIIKASSKAAVRLCAGITCP